MASIEMLVRAVLPPVICVSFPEDEYGHEFRTEVPGGKTAREVAEHQRIQEKTGGVPASKSDRVSNKRDPIGPNRKDLLDGDK